MSQFCPITPYTRLGRSKTKRRGTMKLRSSTARAMTNLSHPPPPLRSLLPTSHSISHSNSKWFVSTTGASAANDNPGEIIPPVFVPCFHANLYGYGAQRDKREPTSLHFGRHSRAFLSILIMRGCTKKNMEQLSTLAFNVVLT